MTTPVISIEYSFPAPRKSVFRAWTEPDQLNVWVWGGIGRHASSDVDLRVGGRYACSITVDNAHGWRTNRWCMCGLYVEVVANSRLVYTVHWDAPVVYNEGDEISAIDEVAIVEFADDGDGSTRVEYAHHGVPDAASAREHEKAIRSTFDLLAKHLRQQR